MFLLFGRVTLKKLWNEAHFLLYRLGANAPGGYNFTRADVLAMPVLEFRFWVERLQQAWKDEQEAHKKAMDAAKRNKR